MKRERLESIIDTFLNEVYVEKPVATEYSKSPDVFLVRHKLKLVRKEGIKPSKGERAVFRISTTADEEGFDITNPEHMALAKEAHKNIDSDEGLMKNNIGNWFGPLNVALKHAKTARENSKNPFLKVAFVSKEDLGTKFEAHEVVNQLKQQGLAKQADCLYGRVCKKADPTQRKITFLIPPESRKKGFTIKL